jgi:Type IV secretion system pilin
MKIKTFFISLLLTVFFVIPVFAQTTESPQSNGNINPPVSQCADGFDNDNDGKIDKTGLKTVGKTYEPDPQCIGSAKCEDGTNTCLSQNNPATCGSGLCLNVKIKNPLKVDSIQGAIGLFMSAILRIAIPFIVIFFIWSGLNFVLARGNPEGIKKAKNMFWYTIIGTLLILGAWTITNIIIGTVNSVTN